MAEPNVATSPSDAASPPRSTHTYYLPRSFAHQALWRAQQFNERMAQKNLPGRVNLTVDFRYTDPEYPQRVPKQIPYHLATHGEFKFGSWRLVGVYEFPADNDTPTRWGFPDGHEHPPTDECRRCEHCNTTRQRRYTFALAGAGGDTIRVGSTCVRPFTGFDPAVVLSFLRTVADMVAADPDEIGHSEPSAYATTEFVAAAATATRVYGYVRTVTHRDTSTRDSAKELLAPRPVLADPLEPVTVADREHARIAIAWAQTLVPTTDFDHNIKTIASSTLVSGRSLGVAAYLPAAYARHLEQERLRELTEQTPPAPVPECDTATIRGEIMRISTRRNHRSGDTEKKVSIRDDRGFTVWGTLPAGASTTNVGDRVTFECATLRRSSDDRTFGFYLEPRAWEVLIEPPQADSRIFL